MLPRALGLILALLHVGSALRPGGAGPWRLGRTVARAAVDEDEAFEMAARAAARAARPLSADDDDDWALEPSAHSPPHKLDGAETGTTTREWRDVRARLCAVGLATTGESDGAARGRAEKWAAARLGGWAHATPRAEAGGLLLRSSFETQLLRADQPWAALVGAHGRRQRTRREMAAAREFCVPAREVARICGEPPACLNKRRYRDAQRYLRHRLRRVVAVGSVDPRRLAREDVAFLDAHRRCLDARHEVVLLLTHDDARGSSGVALGRGVDARLEGSRELSASLCAALAKNGDEVVLDAFDEAFGDRVAVFAGRRGDAARAGTGGAVVVHGVAGLAGARELAPGCGVFVGGAAAAAQLVASGEADADDFAFFVGRYEWAPGELSRHVAAGVHDSVACADTVTLAAARHADRAQTLWHELMFALGGRHRDVCVAELDRPAVSSR